MDSSMAEFWQSDELCMQLDAYEAELELSKAFEQDICIE